MKLMLLLPAQVPIPGLQMSREAPSKDDFLVMSPAL
jgi:hypothetical protein